MKVAEVKGIRLIMGAAKDERGSVSCNTKQWEVLWPLWTAGHHKCPLSGRICSGASNSPVLLVWKRSLVGLQGLQIRSSAFWEMLFDFPLRNFRNLTSSEGVHDPCSTVVWGKSSGCHWAVCVKVWIWVWETIEKPIYMHKLTVLELCGIDSLPAALHFLPRVASVQICEQVRANPCWCQTLQEATCHILWFAVN